MPRDLYDLLGVPKSADSEDIRKAYLIRTQVVHPDRFNRAQQAAEWLQANDMLRELNEAYGVLSDPAKRARYDSSFAEAGPGRHSGEAEEPAHPGSEPASSSPRGSEPDPNGGAVEGFPQLCRDIWLTCWQQIQAGPGDAAKRLLAFEAAYTDYQRRASPWLPIILDNHRGNTPAIVRARNAAAQCLSSLAGGFIGADDLDRAQTLVAEALPLVFDDEELGSKLKGQLDYVASEKRKSAPGPRRGSRETLGAKRSGINIDQKVRPRPARVPGSLFDSSIAAYFTGFIVAPAVLVAILLLTRSSRPQPSPLAVSPEESPARTAQVPDAFGRLTLAGQLEALERASPQEKRQLMPIFNARFNRDIGKVPDEERELFFRRMAAAGLLGISGAETSSAQRAQDGAVPSPTPSPPNPVPSPPSRPTLPPPRATEPCLASSTVREQRRPANGHESDYNHTVKGYGKVTVVNGNSEDAAVMLSGSAVETPDRLFYVRVQALHKAAFGVFDGGGRNYQRGGAAELRPGRAGTQQAESGGTHSAVAVQVECHQALTSARAAFWPSLPSRTGARGQSPGRRAAPAW